MTITIASPLPLVAKATSNANNIVKILMHTSFHVALARNCRITIGPSISAVVAIAITNLVIRLVNGDSMEAISFCERLR